MRGKDPPAPPNKPSSLNSGPAFPAGLTTVGVVFPEHSELKLRVHFHQQQLWEGASSASPAQPRPLLHSRPE